MDCAHVVVSRTASAPLLRTKLIIQNENALQLNTKFSGPLECLDTIIDSQGILSLWRGNPLDIILTILARSLAKSFRSFPKPILNSIGDNYGLAPWVVGKIAIAGIASALSRTLTYPLLYMHLRLATDINVHEEKLLNSRSYHFSLLLDEIKKTFASDGIAGFYRGLVPSLLGILLYRRTYFTLWHFLSPLLDQIPGFLTRKDSYWPTFYLGIIVTTAAAMVSYLFDTISARMALTSRSNMKHRGMLDTVYVIAREEGVGALWDGAGVTIAHGVVGAGALYIFEQARWSLVRVSECG